MKYIALISTAVIFLIMMLIIVIAAIASCGTQIKSDDSSIVNKPEVVTESSPETEIKASAKASVVKKEAKQEVHEFGAGNYVAGKAFTCGTYDFTAISGNGFVSSNNCWDGGISCCLGIPEDDLYQKTFKGAVLSEGCKLTITGVKVRMSKVK
jgi:hypothetical protein